MGPPSNGARNSPVETIDIGDGWRQHRLADGRVFKEAGPDFELTYTGVGVYVRQVAIFGPGKYPGTFDAWCYVYNALRTYSCDRVVRLRELASGETVDGEQLRELLGWRRS